MDVGAFHGHYSVAAATSYPQAKVIAFEPTEDSANKFLLNTVRFGDRVQLHRLGISDTPGEAVIHLTTTGGANSVHPQAAEHRRQNPHVRECGRQKIVLQTLDQALAREEGIIDVLKIDVEGHEMNVLRGAAATLGRTRFVILEVALSRDEDVRRQKVFEIFAKMNQSRFYLYGIHDLYPFGEPHPRLGMAQFDAVFRHHEL